MSFTYSTNLKLALIDTGTESGNWGDVTNTNLGTLLEQSISGYVTQAITDGADTTITMPNGATGVARNMTIEMTGALTAARNLIVPANKKLYFIYNNTTGGYAVTVKVSGQTGVSVPNGAKVALVSNGTDVVSLISYAASLTLGAALGAASGGTGLTAPGTSGNVLTSNGSAWTSASPAIPAGTVALFYQAAAPTGWTQVASQNDKALRVVSGTGGGTGGATAFTSVFGAGKSSSSYTLATTDIPSHTHTGTSGTQSVDHTHTGPSHTHTGPSHTHTGTTGTESANHTHTGPSHTHTGTTGTESANHHHTFGGGAGVVFVNTGAGVTANVGTTGSGDNAPYTDPQNTSHTHSFTTSADGTGSTGTVSANHSHSFTTAADGTGATGASGTGATGGVSANHTHSFTSDATGGGGGHTHGLSLDLQYIDVIIASKN